MANSNTLQVLKDSAETLIVKLTCESDATQEAHVEKINVATLACTAWNLVTDTNTTGISPVGFVPGELLTGNTSGATAYVVRWIPSACTLYVTSKTGNFANSERVTGALSKSFVVLGVPGQVAPVRALNLEAVWYSIPTGTRLSIEWEGVSNVPAAAYTTAVTLFDTGQFDKQSLAVFPVPPSTNAFTSNGSISTSTLGMTANGGYSVVVQFRKAAGFSLVPNQ